MYKCLDGKNINCIVEVTWNCVYLNVENTDFKGGGDKRFLHAI